VNTSLRNLLQRSDLKLITDDVARSLMKIQETLKRVNQSNFRTQVGSQKGLARTIFEMLSQQEHRFNAENPWGRVVNEVMSQARFHIKFSGKLPPNLTSVLNSCVEAGCTETFSYKQGQYKEIVNLIGWRKMSDEGRELFRTFMDDETNLFESIQHMQNTNTPIKQRILGLAFID